ncbi:MAG: hypothetical protein PHQ76_01530 [Caldisericia bacterium]|nr:hypothetical protein [Caldisericia bacterium]
MKIVTDINLNPNIIKYLQGVEDKYLFYKNYNLKHPLALYDTSFFNKLEETLKDFFKIYDNLTIEDFKPKENKNQSDDKGREVIKIYKTFLYSLREHLDDCFNVIKIFVQPQPYFKDDRNQCNWLIKNLPIEIKDFFENIKDYKTYLDNIVNELKHRNGILNYVTFYNEKDGKFCMGYYIANVKNNEYQPIDYIHKEFQGESTAFSFNRDVRYNVFNVFYVSEVIVSFLKGIGIKIDPSSIMIKRAPDQRRQLYQKIMNMPKVFFPDEYFKDVPSVCLLKNGSLKLEYPSQLTLNKLTCNEVLLNHSIDGKTQKFRLLYYKGNNPGI